MERNSPLRMVVGGDPQMVVTPGLSTQERYETFNGDEGQFSRGLRAGFSGISQGQFANEALQQELSGDPNWQATRDIAMRMQEEAAAQGPRVTSLRDIGSLGDAGDYAAGAFGQGLSSMGPSLAASLAVGALTRGRVRAPASFFGGAAAGYGMEKGEAVLGQYSDPALAATSAEDRDNVAMATAAVNAGLEAVVPTALATSVFRRPVNSFLGNVGKNSLTEAATETAQTATGFAGDNYLDPNQELSGWDLADAAVAGALTGGGVTAGLDGASRLVQRAAPQGAPQQPTAQQQATIAPDQQAGPTVPLLPGPAPDDGDGGGFGALYESIKERFGGDVEAAGAKAKDYASEVMDRATEAVKTAQSPQEFIKAVFARDSSDLAKDDMLPPEQDPEVLAAADTAAAITKREQEKAARGMAYYEELLNDPATPMAVKEQLASMDPADPATQQFATRNLVAQRTGEKLVKAIADLTGMAKDLGEKALAAGPKAADTGWDALKRGAEGVSDRLIRRKNNLQDVPPEAMQPLVTALAQRLGPKAADAPKLAQQLVATAARLTPTMRITEAVDRRLRNLSEVVDDEMLDMVTEAAGSDGLRGALARIRSIPSAQSDVARAGGNSFLESLLTAKSTPTVTAGIAKFVDEIGPKLQGMNPTQKANALEPFKAVFGSVKNAQTVIEYYGTLRADAMSRDAELNPGEDDRPEGDVLGLDLGGNDIDGDGPRFSDDLADNADESAAEINTLTESGAPDLRAQYRAPNPNRPFFRVTDQAELRKARREAGPGSRVMTLREYVEAMNSKSERRDTDSPQYVAARVRNDLAKRLKNEEGLDTETVQQALADLESVPMDMRDSEFNKLFESLRTRKTEVRPNLPKLRKQMSVIENAAGVKFSDITALSRQIRSIEDAVERGFTDGAELPKLRKQLDKLETKYSANAEKVLDRMAVVVSADVHSVLGGKDRGASDEKVAKFRSLLDRKRPPPTQKKGESDADFKARQDAVAEYNAGIAATRIGFKMKGQKTPLYLSAESMVNNSKVYGSIAARLSDSISEMLARSDVESLIDPDPQMIVMRRSEGKSTRWGDIVGWKRKNTKRAANPFAKAKWQAALDRAGDGLRQWMLNPLGETDAEKVRALDDLPADEQVNVAMAKYAQINEEPDSIMRSAKLKQLGDLIIDDLLPEAYPVPERGEFEDVVSDGFDGDDSFNFTEERLSQAEAEAWARGPQKNEFVKLLEAEGALDALNDRLDVVASFPDLAKRVQTRIDSTERKIDSLIDAAPLDKRMRDVPGRREVQAPRTAKTIQQQGEAVAKRIASGTLNDADKAAAQGQLEELRAEYAIAARREKPTPKPAAPAQRGESAEDRQYNALLAKPVAELKRMLASAEAEYARAENSADFATANMDEDGVLLDDSHMFADQNRSDTLRALDDRISMLESAIEEKTAPKRTKQNAQSTMGPKKGRPGKIDQQAIVDEIVRIRGDKVKVLFDTFANIGASGEHTMDRNTKERIIKIAVNAANPMGVAWHESLHDFFAMLGEDKASRSIKRDLTDAASAPHVKRKLEELLAKHPKALEQIAKDPEERIAYMYQFWAEGLLPLGPTGTGIFQRLKAFFRDVLGLVGADERAADLLKALHDGKFSDPSVVSEVLADMPSDRFGNKMERASPELTSAIKKLFSAAPDRLRDFQNEDLNKLADMFSSEEGKLGFIQKRFQQQGVWDNKLAGVLEGTTAQQRRAALDNMQAMKPPSSKLEKDLAKFFGDMHDYMSDAGVKTLTGDEKSRKWVPLRRVNNYFPRVFDRNAINNDRDGFVALLKKHGKMSGAQADAVVKALTHGTGQLDLAESEKSLGFTPYANAVQDRQLTFINPSNAAEFAKYQTKDLADTTVGYVRQAVHRAEYARMFGNAGEVITQMVQDSGITDAKELADIGKVIQGLEGSIGNEMSSSTKELMSGLMTLQNLIVLPLAIFSQMIDPIVLAARSGKLSDAGEAYMTAAKRLVGKEVDAEELANTLGIIGQDSVLDALGNAYGTVHMSQRMRKINQVFFKYNGMQGWNNSMRIAATAAGERYLIANKDNVKALDELGLKPSDIKINKKTGRLKVESQQMKEAMYRFVDGAVLRPSASQRPVWMSDPRFLLVAHLKQFTFAMHNVVLKRATRELEDGNPKPWGVLLLAMPTILAADMMKFALTGGAPPGWGFKDHLVHAVERSGLLGLGDFGVQGMRGVDTGANVPGEALLGPTFEHLMELLKWIGGDPQTGVSDVIDRTVPGARFV